MKQESKKKIPDIWIFIGVLIAIVFLFFCLLYLRSYGRFLAHQVDLGCLVGPKLIGFTEKLTKEELKEKLIEYGKAPEELKKIVLVVLDREKENMDLIDKKDSNNKNDLELSIKHIICQQHIVDLLDQIKTENK